MVVVADTATGLDLSMPAVLDSDLHRETFELIIVAESENDEASVAAARYADTVVRLPGPVPPALECGYLQLQYGDNSDAVYKKKQ